MSAKETKGLYRLFKATIYSFQGLKAAYKNEEAFRLELFFLILLAPVGLWLGENAAERSLLLGSLFLVLIVELVNSAIEAVVDRFGGEMHTLSGRAKDIASAAVLVSLINVVVIWGLIFFY